MWWELIIPKSKCRIRFITQKKCDEWHKWTNNTILEKLLTYNDIYMKIENRITWEEWLYHSRNVRRIAGQPKIVHYMVIITSLYKLKLDYYLFMPSCKFVIEENDDVITLYCSTIYCGNRWIMLLYNVIIGNWKHCYWVSIV